MHSRNRAVKTIKTSIGSTEGSNPDSYNTPRLPTSRKKKKKNKKKKKKNENFRPQK